MKTKHLFQIFVLLAVLLSTMGLSQSALAQEGDPVVVIRELTYWDATYTGNVDANRYEKWPFVFIDSHEFTITATPTSGDLVPWLVLMDVNGNELTSGTGSVSSTQPAGSYFVQVQPEAGSGTYDLTIREVEPQPENPAAVTTLSADTVFVDESVTVSVSLINVPAAGYASAEFTCTYPSGVVEVSSIVATDLFGVDPAVAINDPQNSSFIVAIAGSNGQKATTSGVVFTFTATGLQVGQADINCAARVSMGEDGLTDLPSIGATLTIKDVPPVVTDGTLNGQVFASKAVTVELYDAENALVATAAADADGLFSLTAPAGTYTAVATASGFLNAQGPAELVADGTTTKATISLLAGDIDGNGVIDQFDAMTIGMSYNTAAPEAADLNNDGVINVLDLEVLAANYRASGALNWE